MVVEFDLGEPFATLEEEAVADGGGGEGGIARTVAKGGEAEDVEGIALQDIALSAGHGDGAVLGVGVVVEGAGEGEAGDDVVHFGAVDIGGGEGAFAVAFLQEVPVRIGEIEGGGPLPRTLGPGVGAADGAAVATVVGEGQAEGAGLWGGGSGGAEAVVGIPGVGPAGTLEEVALGIIGQSLAVDEGVLVQRVGSVVIRRAVVHLLREVAEGIVLVAHDASAAVGDAGHLVGGVVGVEIVHGGIEVIERFGAVGAVADGVVAVFEARKGGAAQVMEEGGEMPGVIVGIEAGGAVFEAAADTVAGEVVAERGERGRAVEGDRGQLTARGVGIGRDAATGIGECLAVAVGVVGVGDGAGGLVADGLGFGGELAGKVIGVGEDADGVAEVGEAAGGIVGAKGAGGVIAPRGGDDAVAGVEGEGLDLAGGVLLGEQVADGIVGEVVASVVGVAFLGLVSEDVVVLGGDVAIGIGQLDEMAGGIIGAAGDLAEGVGGGGAGLEVADEGGEAFEGAGQHIGRGHGRGGQGESVFENPPGEGTGPTGNRLFGQIL